LNLTGPVPFAMRGLILIACALTAACKTSAPDQAAVKVTARDASYETGNDLTPDIREILVAGGLDAGDPSSPGPGTIQIASRTAGVDGATDVELPVILSARMQNAAEGAVDASKTGFAAERQSRTSSNVTARNSQRGKAVAVAPSRKKKVGGRPNVARPPADPRPTKFVRRF